MASLKARARAFFRSAAEEALGTHIRQLAEGGNDAINTARVLAILNESRDLPRLRDYGFGVYSQFGEDGIVQRLISRVAVPTERFVEIGVQDYSESNTRFLATKDSWSGLIIDAGEAAAAFLQSSGLGLKRAIDFRKAFVTAENVNELLHDEPRDLGLLSLDIDGMDYWVWKALSVIQPAIVVVEYQHRFGPQEQIVVPYDSAFDRFHHHPSGAYYGASLAAFESLSAEKGYILVGTSDGPNAFFVRAELASRVATVTAAECHRTSCYRESPDADELTLISEKHVLDLPSGELRQLSSYSSLFPNADSANKMARPL